MYAHCKADIHLRKVTTTITTQSVAQLLRNPLPETPKLADKIRDSARPTLPVPVPVITYPMQRCVFVKIN